MPYEHLILISALLAASAAVFLVLHWLWKDRDCVDERLRSLARENKSDRIDESCGVTAGQILGYVAPIVSKLLHSKDRIENQKLRLRLSHAGLDAQHAPEFFIAVKTLGLILGVLIGLSLGVAQWGFGLQAWAILLVAAGTGFLLPDLYISWAARNRKQRILHSLPEALDLMVIAAEIGQGMDAVIYRVARDFAARAPDLSAELSLYSAQLRLGRPRREALRDLGMRSGVDDLNAFAAIVAQADRFGSSLVTALRQLSDSMRIKRRQRAEERAQQTAVKLLIPLVLFIFPGIFVVLVGPAAIALINDLPQVR